MDKRKGFGRDRRSSRGRETGASVRRRTRTRHLRLEGLEDRRLLAATDLASVSGLVFDDFTGDGFQVGEQVAGAQLSIHRDNGNGVFDAGTDTLVQSATTGADGRYAFNRLTAGDYFVLQDAQVIGGTSLLRQVSPVISISATAVEGRIVRVVDDFDQTQQQVVDTTNDGMPVTSSVAAPEAIGGERDLFVNKTSVNGAVQLNVDNPLLPNLLTFDSLATGDGERRVTWDGPDGDATVVDDTGLGAVDLTSSAEAIGLQLQIGADLPGGQAVVRLYSDDGNGATSTRFSSATLDIPQTGGAVSSAEFLPFTSFVASGGGGVDINNVGAIELEITGAANVNGTAELVGTVGQNDFTADFSNFETADLSLTKTVSNSAPGIGQNVTFVITANNGGPDGATGVRIREDLPTGLTFISSTPSVGTFDSSTGIWDVGAIASAGSTTLQIVARVDDVGTRTNFAEVIAVDQFDPDSQPDPMDTMPNDASQDDQALVTLTTQAIDLSVTKTANATEVPVGQNVTFTVTVNNAGPSDATGVVIQDLLPAGLTSVSNTPSQGTYNVNNGQWTVNTIAANTSATLMITARVDAAGAKTNVAQVLAADQTDIDSTPGNGLAGEDDQASVIVLSPQIDLSLAKSVSNTNPNVGENVTFTLTLNNAGPDAATGVNVRDVLPTGLSFVSASTGQGSYDSVTGIWMVGTVSSGAAASLGITATATSTGSITNTAEVLAADQPDADSTPANGVETEDDQASVTLQPQQIDLSLNKTVDDATPNRGQPITFTIAITNAGPSAATGVVVRDVLPSGLTLISSTPSVGSYNTGTGQWTVGTIAATSSQTLQIIARVDSNTNLTNTAEVIAAGQTDLDSTPGNGVETEDDQASVLIVPTMADLSLAKVVDNASPNVGQNVTFTLTVQNDGPSPATGVAVTDMLPSGITYVSSAPSQGGYDPGTGVWTVGTLPGSGSAQLQLVGQVINAGAKTNVAQVSASDQFDPDSTPGNGLVDEDDQSSVVVTPPVVDVSLTKVVDQARPNVGATVRYTVTVNNAGPSTATGLVVNDDLPAGLGFVAATPSVGTFDSVTGLWSLGSLVTGGSATLLIDAIVNAPDAITNIAEIVAVDQFDIDSVAGNGILSEDDQASVVFTPAASDLSLTKTVSDPTPNVGASTRFTLQLNNAGPDPATGVQVRDLLPAGLQFVSANTGQGSYDSASGLWTVGQLANGSNATLEIVANVTATTAVTNQAEVVAADQRDPDSTVNNNLATEDDQASVTVTGQQIDLSLTKSADRLTPNVGEDITFTVNVRNDGVSDATGVRVRDVLPPGMSLRRSEPTQGSFNTTTGVWTVGSLAVGGDATLQLIVRVDQILEVTNEAEVIAADQPDLDSTPDNGLVGEDDRAVVTVRTPVADLSLTKNVDNANPNVGDNVTFSVVVRNDGPDSASGVQVTDLLPAGIQFVSTSLSQGTYDSTTGIWTIGSLDSTNTASLSIIGQITGGLPGSTEVKTNVAEITAVAQADPDSTPGNRVLGEDDQAEATVQPTEIDLSLQKGIDNPTPSVGEEVSYSLTLRNDGRDQATGIQVQDLLPDGVTLASVNELAGSYNVATGIWSIANLDVGASAELRLNVVVNSHGTIVNSAEVIAADQVDRDSTPANNVMAEDDQTSVSLSTQSADLSVRKTVSQDRPGVGDVVTFIVEVSNAGPDAAEGVRVRDVIPSGLGFQSSSPSQGSYDAVSGEWLVGNLASGQSATLGITVTVDTFGDKVNVAEVVASSEFDPDSTVNNNVLEEDDQASVTLSPQLVDLALEKAIDVERPNRGDIVTFLLSLSNSGPSTATGVQVRDVLNSSLTFEGATASSGTYSPLTGIWTVGEVLPNETPTLSIRALVGDTAGDSNVAEVIAVDQPDSDSTPGNGNDLEDDYAQVSFRTQIADLSLQKQADRTSVNQDEPVIFTLTLRNDGPDEATNVVVADRLPGGLIFVESTTSSGTYDANSGRWTVSTVPVGQPATLQILARVDSVTPQTNQAEVVEVRQFDPDSQPGNGLVNEDDQAEVVVTPVVVDVSVEASVDNQAPLEGEEVTLTFTARNEGPSDASGLLFRTLLPAELSLVSVVPGQGTYDSTTGLWDLGSLRAGANSTLVFRAVVTERGIRRMPIELIAADQFDIDSNPANGIVTEDDQQELLIRAPRLLTKRLFLAR